MAASATIYTLLVASVISYLVLGEEESARHVLRRLTRHIPLQSGKIITVVVAWQILTDVNISVVFLNVQGNLKPNPSAYVEF